MDISHGWIDGPSPILPSIADGELLRRHERFRLAHGEPLRFVDMSPRKGMSQIAMLRKISCIWDPAFGDLAEITDTLSAYRVLFWVGCGYHGFFKPSVAEVLASIPEEVAESDELNSFYIEPVVSIHRSGSFQQGSAVFVKAFAGDDRTRYSTHAAEFPGVC
jgi:hypothetical protein